MPLPPKHYRMKSREALSNPTSIGMPFSVTLSPQRDSAHSLVYALNMTIVSIFIDNPNQGLLIAHVQNKGVSLPG